MWRIKCSFMRTWFEFNDTSWETLEWRINHGSWVSVICGRRRGRAGGDVRRSCRGRRDGLLRTHERWGEWWQDKLSTATQYCVQKRSSGFVRKLLRFKSFSLNILPANIKRSHHSQTQPNFWFNTISTFAVCTLCISPSLRQMSSNVLGRRQVEMCWVVLSGAAMFLIVFFREKSPLTIARTRNKNSFLHRCNNVLPVLPGCDVCNFCPHRHRTPLYIWNNSTCCRPHWRCCARWRSGPRPPAPPRTRPAPVIVTRQTGDLLSQQQHFLTTATTTTTTRDKCLRQELWRF